MAGHVFVVRGDMRRLACDAWSLPCDVHRIVVRHWIDDDLEAWSSPMLEALRGYVDEAWGHYQARDERLEVPADWGEDGARVAALRGWDDAWGPRPWLVSTGTTERRSVGWYLEGVRQYLERVEAELSRSGAPPRHGRARPLVAVHAAGTGFGGAGQEKARVIWRELQVLYAFASRPECAVDVVFVAGDAGAYAAAQACRRTGLRDPAGNGAEELADLAPSQAVAAERPARDPGALWDELTPEQRETMERLARLATDGHLVLFVGAGVSVPAGLPTWSTLLAEMVRETALAEQAEAVARLDPVDQAELLERHAGRAFRAAIAERFTAAHHALGHALLASLPVHQVVTTNFDRLYELASRGAGHEVAVIPGSEVTGRLRWLLKLHGCVDRPEEIVLTREDFLRYADRRAALGGIVQALLITKHMLFVGFSLSDPNFHRIVHDVRKVVRPAGEGAPFGTVLLLKEDSLRRQLWSGELEVVSLGPKDGDAAAAARRHDVLLDDLACRAAGAASYLLDPSYDHALSDDERELRDALRQLEVFRDRLAGRSAAWRAVERLLAELGG